MTARDAQPLPHLISTKIESVADTRAYVISVPKADRRAFVQQAVGQMLHKLKFVTLEAEGRMPACLPSALRPADNPAAVSHDRSGKLVFFRGATQRSH